MIISSKAQIKISRALFINAPWNSRGRNYQGTIKIDDYAQVTADDFSVHYGAHISVASNATLILKSGFINYNCEICCAER